MVEVGVGVDCGQLMGQPAGGGGSAGGVLQAQGRQESPGVSGRQGSPWANQQMEAAALVGVMKAQGLQWASRKPRGQPADGGGMLVLSTMSWASLQCWSTTHTQSAGGGSAGGRHAGPVDHVLDEPAMLEHHTHTVSRIWTVSRACSSAGFGQPAGRGLRCLNSTSQRKLRLWAMC